MSKNACKKNVWILAMKLAINWFGPFSDLVAITGGGGGGGGEEGCVCL